jgi:hypothetical protein
MYRQYEDPYALEKQLTEKRQELDNCDDEAERMWLGEEINELEERVNFAWQDDEFDEDCRREEGGNY